MQGLAGICVNYSWGSLIPYLVILYPRSLREIPEAPGGFRLCPVSRLQGSQDKNLLGLSKEVTEIINLGQDVGK